MKSLTFETLSHILGDITSSSKMCQPVHRNEHECNYKEFQWNSRSGIKRNATTLWSMYKCTSVRNEQRHGVNIAL